MTTSGNYNMQQAQNKVGVVKQMKMSQNIRIWKMSPSLVRVMKSRNLRWHGNNKCV